MRRRVLFFIFVLVAIVAMAFLLLEEREARVAGKPVSYWLDEMSEGSSRSNAAVQVFLREGSAAIPALTNALRYAPATRTNYIQLKAELPWAIASRLPQSSQPNWPRRSSAVEALKALGSQAKSAVPALIATVTVGEPVELAMRGPNGGMLMGHAWHPGLRERALEALGAVDGQNPEVLKIAARVVADSLRFPPTPARPDPGSAALRVLEAAQKPDAAVIHYLLQTLRTQERQFYFETLGATIGKSWPGATRGYSLSDMYSQSNTAVILKSSIVKDREAAAFELGDADRESVARQASLEPQSIAALFEALNDSAEKVRLNAAETLVKGQGDAEPGKIVAALTGLMRSTNTLIRLRAVDNLRQLGPRAAPALGTLEIAHTNDVGVVRVWAKQAMDEIAR